MAKNVLFIEGRRNGYSPDQCGRTITVGELIEFLGDFDEETVIFIRNDRGFTYGNITRYSIEEDYYENEDDENEEE